MPDYVIHHLKEGDIITVNIWEEKVSEKIPPVPLPLHIVYQDSLFVFFQLYQILAGVMFSFQELFYSKAVF